MPLNLLNGLVTETYDLIIKNWIANYAVGRNKLADALVSMQTKLRTINENDEKRKWVNEGLNTFADILRSSQDIQKLGDKIMSAVGAIHQIEPRGHLFTQR